MKGMKMRAVMVWLALTCSGCPLARDWNGDNVTVVAAIGDSNTYERNGPSWCERVATAHPLPQIACHGIGGMRADSEAAWQWIDTALATAPDVVILALGTNDIFWSTITAEALVNTLLAQAAHIEAAGAVAVVALIPRMIGYTQANVRIDEANRLLSEWRPNTSIDFVTDFVTEDYEADGIHFTAAGSIKRAARAEAILW